jgi:catechol 2,3-dioxygenase-like lactoylglutathione lyase family enzyme
MPDSTAYVGNLEVGIIVRDLETMTQFYGDGLGLPHVADYTLPFGLMRRFACGDGIVKLVQLDDAPTVSNPPGGVHGGSTGLRWFTLGVGDIEEVFRRCEAAGGRVVQPIEEWRPGSKLMILEDPEGNCWIEISERRRDA